MTHSYRGGCQCGAVLYEVELDLHAPAASSGPRSVWHRVVPPRSFRLLKGEDVLSGLQFGQGPMHNFYCAQCGAHAYSRHAASDDGAFYVVDLLALRGKNRARATPLALVR